MEFSKTRLCYYNNSQNIINKDSTLAIYNCEDNTLMKIAKVTGNTHGWHNIPRNMYGLYMTPSELQCIASNYEFFEPESIDVTISHNIPLSKLPNATGTTISFNNTIYSLIANIDSNIAFINSEFISNEEIQYFFRTFDGSSVKDNSRLLLPQSDFFFKFPSDYTTGNKKVKIEIDGISEEINVTTDQQKAFDYYSEFLQNNDTVHVLYPGENEDSYIYTDPNNTYAKVPCNSQRLGEYFNNLDSRFQYIIALENTGNTSNDINNLIYTPVYPQFRGPKGKNKTSSHNPNVSNLSAQFYSDRNYGALFTTPMSNIWLKGVPILDHDGNLINHTFLATITWTIKITGQLRSPAKPLKYGYKHYNYKNYIISGKDSTGNAKTKGAIIAVPSVIPKDTDQSVINMNDQFRIRFINEYTDPITYDPQKNIVNVDMTQLPVTMIHDTAPIQTLNTRFDRS